MLLLPGTYVKRDNVVFKVHGLDGDFVYLTNHHLKTCRLDLRLGMLRPFNYVPYELAEKTGQLEALISIMFPDQEEGMRSVFVQSDYERADHQFDKCWKLECYLNDFYQPILLGMIRNIDAKELHQGVKSVYGFEIPKMMVCYLTNGYHFDGTVECLIRDIRKAYQASQEK